MKLDAVLLAGGLVATFAFSARAAYEELDQDVPYVKWPLAVLEGVGYAVVAYALVRGRPLGNAWVLPVAAAALLFLAVVLQATNLGGVWGVKALQTGGYAALAAALALRGAPWTAAAAAATLVLVHTMLLPAELERRITHGPAMSLLVVAWGAAAYAAASVVAGAGSAADVSVGLAGAFAGTVPPPSASAGRTFSFPDASQSSVAPGFTGTV
jgi:hypothetical protein